MKHFSGRFENITKGHVTGWARSESGHPVRVCLYVDGQYIHSGLADNPHPEMQTGGFTLPLPLLEPDRAYQFDVRYADIDISLNNEPVTAILCDHSQNITVMPPDAESEPEVSASEATQVPPPSSAPTSQKLRIAFILSTRDGGVPETNRDLMSALDDTYEPWLIICDSIRIDVFSYHPDGERHRERIVLRQPVEPTTLQSDEYDTAMRDIMKRCNFSLVHIRHMGWHASSLPALCKQLDVPVLMSLHDYYTVCPTIKLLDDQHQHCGGRCSDSKGECQVELWQQKQFPPLKNNFVKHWRKRFDEALSHCDGYVTTSEAAKNILQSAHPSLSQSDFRLIEHGRDFPENTIETTPWPKAHEPLKILVPGGISPAKGANIINALIALNTNRLIEFHILGNAWYIDKNHPDVYDHGPYKRDDFAAHVHAIRPHIGAVFSIWAETYCHTLTEMWACNLPVIGLDIGAVGERIKAHGGGWLMPVNSDPEDIFKRLKEIKTAPPDNIYAHILEWHQAHNAAHTTQHMARAYEQFYADIRANAKGTGQ